VADLQARLAGLTPEQRALFEQLLAEQGGGEDTFPLSVFQQGMWFLEQLRPFNPAYVVPSALRLRGPLDVGLLRRAVATIVGRHEALRTTFELRDGKPVQVVHPALDVDVPELDLRGEDLDDAALQARVVAEALGEPMSIEQGPLVRLRLLRTGDDDRVLVLALHHLISDRWSIGILMAEVAALYAAYAQGEGSPLPPLPIQYGDFATWQQEQLQAGAWADDLAYWREHLAGAPAALELPTDRARAAVQGFNGSFLPVELPPSLVGPLGGIAHARGATTYMALLACYAVLLHRYSGQDDVVVGVPTAVRGSAELEALIGYFVNTVPIRISLDGDPTWLEVLHRVRTANLGAYEHQEVPFDVVVADLKTARDLSRSPVYQVSFSFGREPAPTFRLGDAESTRLPVRSGGARFDLELQAFDRDGGLGGWFEYDRDLFDEPTIARLAGHFRHLVEEVVADPDRAVSTLPLLTADERAQVVHDVNATDRVWPAERGWIHQCFEEQARRTPDRPALRFEGAELSYAETNRRANRLAHRLIALGVGRDVLVGVAMERSLELVIALQAVAKAGGAYVPLDPELPAARLEQMLATARPRVVLVQARHAAAALAATDADVLVLEPVERPEDWFPGEPDTDPDVAVDGEDAAYVIYTSGSTGAPKGVVNVHAGIRNRLLWMQDAFPLDGTDRVLQKTPFSFDVSVWEFFWPLMVGATLVVARPGGHKDGRYLADLMLAEGVTTVHFVPSMLQVFLTERVEDCTGLRRVICSGEALPRDLADRFLERSGAELHNLYGPTEAAIDVTHWPCRRGEEGPVPIGRPIANTQVYVLDRHGEPVPAGVAGELHLGGRNLARGYLGRPDLTAERFVDDPFSAVPGARLYRTGDLARLRADGVVEFLGRLDHQVKLRGFRIELGEIESVLVEHPQVREAVVVAHTLRAGDVRLAAYLTAGPSPSGPPEAGELAAWLRGRLPEYMVPATFDVLDAFPLTTSGKVDRKRLPAPSGAGGRSGGPFVAPADALEETLAELWRQVLGVERVGRDDTFFDLGGHSLLLAEVRTLLAERTGRDLSMVELFQHPTIASLAGYLARPAADPTTTGEAARERADLRRDSLRRRQEARARTRTGSDR